MTDRDPLEWLIAIIGMRTERLAIWENCIACRLQSPMHCEVLNQRSAGHRGAGCPPIQSGGIAVEVLCIKELGCHGAVGHEFANKWSPGALHIIKTSAVCARRAEHPLPEIERILNGHARRSTVLVRKLATEREVEVRTGHVIIRQIVRRHPPKPARPCLPPAVQTHTI